MVEVDDIEAVAWLQNAPNGGWAGIDARGWPASIWVLHAIYERFDLPTELTWDDVARARPEQSAVDDSPAARVRAIVDRLTTTGVSIGRSQHPRVGWGRLRWSALADRLGIRLFDRWPVPGDRCFPFASWPASIRPPAQGGLDRDQYRHLLDILADLSEAGQESRSWVRYAPCWEWTAAHTLLGSLSDARDQYDRRGSQSTPNNLWANDHSWFVYYTDYDLMGTKVSASAELITALIDDPELETVQLPDHPSAE